MIHKSEVRRILAQIGGILACKNVVCLGSTGKQEWSNDVDVGVSDVHYTLEGIRKSFMDVGKQPTVHYGLQCVSVPMALDEERSVKVDIFVGNLEWLNFAYWSPGDESAYKGAYRTELIRAVANATTFYEAYEKGEIIAKIGYAFTNTNGLKMVRRARPQRKVGSGRIQKFIEVSDSYWKSQFGHKTFTYHSTTDPNEAAQWLFGVNADQLETFEQVSDLVNQMPIEKQIKIDIIYQQKLGHSIDQTPTK